MDYSIPARSNCFFQRHSRVIDPASIHKIDDAVGTLGPELSGHGVDNQPGPVFRALALGYVDDRTDVFNEIARWTENRMAYGLNVPDFAFGMNHPKIELEPCHFSGCFFELFD